MSDLLDPLEILLDLKSKAEKKPAPRWKNRYLALHAGIAICNNCGTEKYFNRGDEEISHCYTWPSREEAEALGKATAAHCRAHGFAYLGAIPVDPR